MESPDPGSRQPKLLFLVTEDWYFWSHRLPIARAARDAGYDVNIAARITDHGEKIKSEGFRLHPLHWQRRGGLVDAIRAFGELWRLYRQIRPDILHHIAIKPVVYGSIVARAVGCRAIINSINGLGFAFTEDGLRARTIRATLRVLFKIAVDRPQALLLLQNKDDQNTLTKSGFVKRSKLAILRGSGIETNHYLLMPDPTEPVFTVATVTRMLTIKGVEDVVEASRILRRQGIRHRLLLVGPPDPDNPSSIDGAKLSAWAKEPGIEWLGRIDDVRDIWSKAHVAILASLGGEGVPKTLLEAAACGRPLVATDVPGCREIVRHGITGLLVNPRSPHQLADAIRILRENPEMRHRFGIAARQLAEADFSTDYIARTMLTMYQDTFQVVGRGLASNDKSRASPV